MKYLYHHCGSLFRQGYSWKGQTALIKRTVNKFGSTPSPTMPPVNLVLYKMGLKLRQSAVN